MFSGLWEAAKNSPFQRVGEAHCDAPQKQLVAGRTISAASTGKEEEEGKAEVDNRLMGRQTDRVTDTQADRQTDKIDRGRQLTGREEGSQIKAEIGIKIGLIIRPKRSFIF